MKPTNRPILTVLLFLISAGAGLFAQDLNQRLADVVARTPDAGEYLLGGGDLLDISVIGVEELKRSARVSESGLISFPYLGELKAAGKSSYQLAREIESKLREAQLILRPEVTVVIAEYRSQAVSVLGAVNKPGRFFLNHRQTLADVLAQAEGLNPETAGDEVLIQRSSKSGQDPTVLRVDLKRMLLEGDHALNYAVKAGDVVNVVERKPRLFYAIGDVGQGGAYPLPVDKELRLSQAVALAGGTTRTAKLSETIIRRIVDGRSIERRYDLKKILKGKIADPVIELDDVVYVPGSSFKNFFAAAAGVVPRVRFP